MTTPATPEEHHQQLVEQSEKWVAQTFYGQLLKQMHNSPFKNPKFEGGRGGEAFGQMFDQRLAEGMSRGAGRSLVNSMVKRIERGEARKAYGKQSGPTNEVAKWTPSRFNTKH
jgi:Rod binding domain-containing protein